MKSVSARFLELVQYDTQSDEHSDSYPSTEAQLVLAKKLAEECRAIGLEDVECNEHGYVIATLPSNTTTEAPTIGFLAHMDTSPDAAGGPVNARIIEQYDGGDIILDQESSIILSPDEFPHLQNYVKQDIIVTDGKTLLGADNKAGIAEILAAMEYFIKNPDVPHGRIRIAFTPDEEIGRGVNHFDVKKFGADFAYTIDGGEIGELESETFNAAQATFTIKGKSVHPGTSKGIMKNASIMAGEIIAAFPPTETPAHTEGREGFYHLADLQSEVGRGHITYILRDFDAEGLVRRKEFVQSVATEMNRKHGEGTVEVKVHDQYRNMSEILKDHQHIIQLAHEAMKEAGITAIMKPVRGGTDGARLSFMGLPCPNIFAGGHNFHGPYEYIPIPSMEAAVQVIINICKRGVSK